MANIKLFVCCHQPAEVPEHPLLIPIQVGAALADTHFPGFFYDDTGDNISCKNRSYCELTAQCWAWKNIAADYYGFFHYRRYLYPGLRAKRPYCIAKQPSLALLDKLGYAGFAELISQYDLILPKGENMYIPVREHYASAPYHHAKDLESAVQILLEFYPEYEVAAGSYLSGMTCYFGNIYIMKQQVFQDYCAWLFPILEEFDRRADTEGYDPQERRVNGYLAERLLGVFSTKLRNDGVKTLELPRVDFIAETWRRRKRQTLFFLMPPGTRRRAMGKKLLTWGMRCENSEQRLAL